MRTAIDETLVRDIVQEILGQLGRGAGQNGVARAPAPTQPAASGTCSHAGTCAKASGGRHYGVFGDVDEACEAADAAFRQLREKGVAGRQRVIELVKKITYDNAAEWGRLELEETKIGRLDHKIEKLQVVRNVPGVEFLHPTGLSGDGGITLEEHTPFGVIGAVTPSTHSIPTLAGNVVSMVAGGNGIVFNPHPGAARCASVAVRAFNEAIHHELGIENLICCIEAPTLEGFAELTANEHVKLLCITGGPGVVKAAMQSSKRAICGGPGNPPVLVDETVDLEAAARKIVQGAAFDNNLLCIGEKEIFVLAPVFDRFMAAMERARGFRLGTSQLERLSRSAFVFPQGQGAGCSHASVNRDLVGRDATVLAREAGAQVPADTQVLFAETAADDLWVMEEQMMPVLPVVRVKSVEEGIACSLRAEHGFRHTAIIHSHDVSRMTAMARALDTTLFVKNGPSVAGLGMGGEGYLSYTIATPTGEGITNPATFTRIRRCVMSENLRIY